MEKKCSLGVISPVFKGIWQWDVEYNIMDVVSHDEKSYVALDNAENVEPGTNDKYWALVAQVEISQDAIDAMKEVIRREVDDMTYFVTDNHYHHTDFNFTDQYKEKVEQISSLM